MCLGIPGRIVRTDPDHPDLAEVDVAGLSRLINVGILGRDALRPGDWVLIHAGFAMEKIDEEKAKNALAFLRDYTADPEKSDEPAWQEPP